MSDMRSALLPRSFSVAEYHRMAAAGLFDVGPAVELLDGVVVEMSPIGKRHWVTHARIVRYLTQALEGRAEVIGQLSLPLGDRNEPQPDIAVLAPSAVADTTTPVDPSEIVAMIEIAERSLLKDMGPKRLLYARFGVPNYLIVDLSGDILLNYIEPVDGDYAVVRRLGRAEQIELLGVTLDVAELLPQSQAG